MRRRRLFASFSACAQARVFSTPQTIVIVFASGRCAFSAYKKSARRRSSTVSQLALLLRSQATVLFLHISSKRKNFSQKQSSRTLGVILQEFRSLCFFEAACIFQSELSGLRNSVFSFRALINILFFFFVILVAPFKKHVRSVLFVICYPRSKCAL